MVMVLVGVFAGVGERVDVFVGVGELAGGSAKAVRCEAWSVM